MKNLLKSFLFFLGLLIVTSLMHTVFRFKYADGIEPLEEYYKLDEESLDVIFFGSSHAFTGVNPAVIWREQGIRSYVLGGSQQPFWNTYYYMKESLKYQTPKVFVMDIFSSTFNGEFSDYSTIIKNNLGLRLSSDKIESIKVSSPKENWKDLFLAFPAYHSRYKELTRRDFQFLTGRETVYTNGCYQSDVEVTKIEKRDVSDTFAEWPLSAKNDEYLYKIIELCKTAGVELVFVVIPYETSTDNQMRYNTIKRIAMEEQVRYLNYNLLYDEIALDCSRDFADIMHLNAAGSRKVSAHLAQYLKAEFHFEDKRDNELYRDWNSWAALLE